MLRTELTDLTNRFEVTLNGTTGWWTCQLVAYRDRSRFSGAGETPEEAVADALETSEYRSDVQEIR